MKHSFKFLVTVSAVLSTVFIGGTAFAQATPVEAACHAAIAKNITKYQARLAKNLTGCHKQRSGGKTSESTDCNDAIGADLKTGRDSARQKATEAINKKCTLVVPADTANVRALYPRCPSPVATSDDGVPTTGIDDFTELATCLLDLSEAYIDRIGTQVMGAPTGPFPLADGLATCQGGVGKALSKAIKTVGSTYSKCQATQEKGGGSLDYSTCITTGDSGGKAGAAIAAITAAIDSSCLVGNVPSQADWVSLGMCGQTTVQMADCAVDRVTEPTARGLVAAALEFPNTAGNLKCAASADVLINAAFGQKFTNTRLDLGYTGLGHNTDVADGSMVGVKLQGCNADCENCQVRIDPSSGYCRCENNATIQCSAINAADAACGGNACLCMFGPPQPQSWGSTPICVVNRFANQLTGGTTTAGEYSVGMDIRAVGYTGISVIQPCPTCLGDANVNDGLRGGVCSGGMRNGSTCDANGEHPDFGAVSYDCPPQPAANISGSGAARISQLTSGTVGFTASRTTGSGTCAAGTCHCSQCSGDSLVGCATTADCTPFGAGTCGRNLGADNPRQNSCTAGVADCVADPDNAGMGKCTGGPSDKFCLNALRSNGGGIIPCSNDAACDTYDAYCEGGDCGLCVSGLPHSQRSCFLPTISATGTPGIFDSEAVSVSCSAGTSSSTVNSAFGLPGPNRMKLGLDFKAWCDAAHTTPFQLPAGSNCP